MNVRIKGKFIALSFKAVCSMGIAAISTLGKPHRETVACLTKGGLQENQVIRVFLSANRLTWQSFADAVSLFQRCL